MDCGLCSKSLGGSRPAVCPSCARASIYEARIAQIKALSLKSGLHRKIGTLLDPLDLSRGLAPTTDGQTIDLLEGSKKLETEQWKSQIARIDHGVQDIQEQQELMRQQIKAARAENDIRKRELALRHLENQARKDELTAYKSPRIEPVQTEIKRLHHKLGKVNNRMMQGRLQLCRETARLAGLAVRRRKTRDNRILEDYTIGSIPITDLRDLNTAHPDAVGACLSNITRLVTTCCHYLSIRPPAEIICQHPDFPHPAMLSLQSSYRTVDGTSLHMSQSTLGSVSSSRTLSGRSPRPKLRPLHLEKPLPRLAKEDPASYNLFLEGVTLLAYDVAWLCKTQGITTVNSWEDVCDIGQNLWHLFMADHDDEPTGGNDVTKVLKPHFGEYSHATSFKNLAASEGTDLLRASPLTALTTVSDKLKSHLLTEMSGAEWELVDEKEWNEDRDDEQPVVVGGTRLSTSSRTSTTNTTTTISNDDDPSHKPSSGWMKLKSRKDEK